MNNPLYISVSTDRSTLTPPEIAQLPNINFLAPFIDRKNDFYTVLVADLRTLNPPRGKKRSRVDSLLPSIVSVASISAISGYEAMDGVPRNVESTIVGKIMED